MIKNSKNKINKPRTQNWQKFDQRNFIGEQNSWSI